jgi:hypothetical protein
LVTAFHGNTDSMVGALGLAAAYALWRRRPGWAGLLLALCVNVKIVGLIWAPCLALLCADSRARLRFVGGMALGMLPFAWPLWTVAAEFQRNVLLYTPWPRDWGLYLFVSDGVGTLGAASGELEELFLFAGRYLIILGVMTWAFLGRWARISPFRATTLAMAAFLSLTPGFGVQYLVWIVPSLAAVSFRASLRYAILGGFFALLLYVIWLQPGWPLASEHRGIPMPASTVGLFAWATLVAFQWQSLKGIVRAKIMVSETD